MYLAVDIGGSKTLVAVFNHAGQIIRQERFITPKNYSHFLKQLFNTVGNEQKFDAICIAAPGKIDRKTGVALDFGNLNWHHTPLKDDVSKFALSPHTPVLIENDSNLAGLSEAVLVKDHYQKVLYLTASTGIGDGIIIDGKIDEQFQDSESGQMILEHDGKLQKWEDFASGRALFKKYGKKASELNDTGAWKEYAKGLAAGMGELIATLTPEVIIIGGGIGAHYEKFEPYLKDELKKYESKLVKLPPIIKAKRPEEAVIYGCYELIKQTI